MPKYALDLAAVAGNHVILSAALCVVAGCGAALFGRLRAGPPAAMGTSWLLVALFAAGAAAFQFAVVTSEPTPAVSPVSGQAMRPPWYDGWLLAGVYPRSMSMYHVASLTLLIGVAATFLGFRLALGGAGQRAASGIALTCLVLTLAAGTAIAGADIQWHAAFRYAATVGVLAAVVCLLLYLAARKRGAVYTRLLSQAAATCSLLTCGGYVGLVCMLGLQGTPLDRQLSPWQNVAAYGSAWTLFGVMLCLAVIPADAYGKSDSDAVTAVKQSA